MGESDRTTGSIAPGNPVGHLAAATGRNLLAVAPPMSGKRSFGLSVLGRATENGRDGLVVATSRRVTTLPFDPAEAGRFGVVDCTPSEVEEKGPVVNVGSPGDLTGISMPASRFLEGADSPVVLFDSVSSVLQYADEESAFRFFSVLTAHVAGAGGVGLYTFDAGVHTEQTRRTFAQLFDGRIELRGGDGSGGATEVRISGLPGIPNGWTRTPD